ncbi:flagellar export protein FliJ [Bacillus massiliglaciei]|uniref:flagellar export protein FliJ n=1 Tax=Bacillus massiliglaciei TaxID=1816693 RepID=UPI000DA61693|nr:flagellar export protein FliJ [Bacillus massiliglaciei]
MMFQYKFGKILSIREKEKADALSKYNESMKRFEEAAEKLYKLLKKKEELLDFQQEKLVTGLSVQDIRQHQLFMDNLEKIIEQNQKTVMETRYIMNKRQQELMDKNVEVRKYEKIKENDFTRFLDGMKEEENKSMDEISIRQFLNKG